ncbi:MAG: OmpA family protein [Candidatus Brocadiales bacterium]
MKKKKKSLVEEKLTGPDMLSFTGMMLILLAFFIVLSTMAEDKKTERMKSAQRSFVESLDSYGLSRVLAWKKGIVNIDRIGADNTYPMVKEEELMDNGALCTMIENELKVTYRRTDSKVVIPTPIAFEPKEAKLSPTSEDFLNRLIKLVKNRPCKIIIEGHVDNSFIPSERYSTSWELSAARATSVAQYLHEKGKISFNRLSTIGYGKFRPIVGNDTPGRRKKNNRVNIIISDKT